MHSLRNISPYSPFCVKQINKLNKTRALVPANRRSCCIFQNGKRLMRYFCFTLVPITSEISVTVIKALESRPVTSFFTLGIWNRFTTK